MISYHFADTRDAKSYTLLYLMKCLVCYGRLSLDLVMYFPFVVWHLIVMIFRANSIPGREQCLSMQLAS